MTKRRFQEEEITFNDDVLRFIFNIVPFDDVRTRLKLLTLSKSTASWMRSSSIAMMTWLQNILPSKDKLKELRVKHYFFNNVCVAVYQQTSSLLMMKLCRYLIKDSAFQSAYFDALSINPSNIIKFMSCLAYIDDHYTYRYQINTENGTVASVNQEKPRGNTLLKNVVVCLKKAPWVVPLIDYDDIMVVSDMPETFEQQKVAMRQAIDEECDAQKKELMRFYKSNSRESMHLTCFFLTSHKRQIRKPSPNDFYKDVLYQNRPIYSPEYNQCPYFSCISTTVPLEHVRKTVMMDVTKDKCQKELISRMRT